MVVPDGGAAAADAGTVAVDGGAVVAWLMEVVGLISGGVVGGRTVEVGEADKGVISDSTPGALIMTGVGVGSLGVGVVGGKPPPGTSMLQASNTTNSIMMAANGACFIA